MHASARTTRQPSPLPAALTPLLGRARESQQVHELVTDPAQRLVTITGPGGVGKTRLALHVAASVLDAFDGAVAFVPLASIREPRLVLPEIAQAFGVFSDVRGAPEDQLAEVLRDDRVLLVLDNLEQVIGIAPALATVLARCPHVTMLVTSQTSLDIAGEQCFPLAPLPTPDAGTAATDAILASDAVALFIQRARAVQPALTVDDRIAATIGEICRKLDGLPLAIELAAARTLILSPAALLARLSERLHVLGSERQDVPDRLRTMRDAVAWSYDLLAPDQQALFRRLAVFAGGIPLDAAEAVCPPASGGREPFDLLSALARHSLLRARTQPNGEPRFLLLETLRDYGLEQLRATDEETDARLAHASFFAALADTAEPQLTGRGQEVWIERLEQETENLRAACTWALDHGHEEIALRIGGALWRFCSRHGLTADCRAWLTRALAADSTCESPGRARALVGLGNLFEDTKDIDAARDAFEQARDIAHTGGHLIAESEALIGLGTIAQDVGDYAQALDYHSHAARLARESGNQHCIARAVGNLGTVSYFRGNLADAERAWDECRQLMMALGDVAMEAVVSTNLGAIAFDRGDLERAEQLQQRALHLQRQMKATRDIPYTLVNLGEVLCLLGDYTQSHDCFAEAIQTLREQGNTTIEGQALHGLAALMKAQGDLVRAATLMIESTRLLSEAGDQHSLIGNAELLAEICAAHGHHTGVVTLVAAATHNREAIGTDPTPALREELDALDRAARSALGDQQSIRARELGSQADFEAMARRIVIIAREIVGTQQPFPDCVDDLNATEPKAPPAVEHNLTPRETEVLRLLAHGKSTQEVAEALSISPRTVATHLTNILGKLDVPSRTAAVAWALRAGIA